LCLLKISSWLAQRQRCGSFAGMIDVFNLLGGWFVGLFRSQAGREAEIMFLRHQLLVLRRSAPPRLRLRTADRVLFVWLYRLFPSVLGAAIIFKPETLVRWHRSGFRLYWRWKSRRRVGRPKVPTEIRDLVRTINRDNPLWGAPRIHGELLKLGIDIAQSTVAKYMCRRRHPPSTSWRAFLRIHTAHIAVISTIGFKFLCGLVILRLERRRLVWINVTAHPTAEWVARQITEAFPWNEAPRYLIRDRDTCFGVAVTRRLRAMGIRDRPISPRSPWQNGHVERLIGSIRRECLDHVVPWGSSMFAICSLITKHITIAYAHTSRSTKMRHSADHRRQSVGSHQSHGSAVSIISTLGWHNW
jgi:transposase InsO family protein